jgi:putative SOS response-associated peptidase YedK
MCGRYATTRGAGELTRLFEASDDTGGRLAADWNVAPTDPVPVVRMTELDDRTVSVARWGLLPAWAKNPRDGSRMINARAETVATSRAYAPSFARRRCLVPADGWYEWVRRPDGVRQPYYLTPADGDLLTFAGLWSRWSPPGDRARGGDGPGASVLTCSVITTEALGPLARVHDRMPLVLPRDRWAAWLAGGGDPVALLAPPDAATLAAIEVRPVGRAVGDVRNNGPHLVAPAPLAGPEPAAPPLF